MSACKMENEQQASERTHEQYRYLTTYPIAHSLSLSLFLSPAFILQINLRLILVSGKTKEFLFSPSDSAGDIAQTVFDQWPEGKCN